MNNTELKPCPFCNGEAKMRYCENEYIIPFYFVSCSECGCKQASSIHKESVIESWNRRAEQ